MDNPLKDLINKAADAVDGKSSKNTSTSTTAKKSTSGVTTAKAKAALGMMKSKSESVKKLSLDKQKEEIAKKTNQDIINAVYKIADELKLKGGPWPLLRTTGWGHLTDDRGSLYKGPAIDEIDALTAEQKAALKKVLGL
jgi:hypothetical protein